MQGYENDGENFYTHHCYFLKRVLEFVCLIYLHFFLDFGLFRAFKIFIKSILRFCFYFAIKACTLYSRTWDYHYIDVEITSSVLDLKSLVSKQ